MVRSQRCIFLAIGAAGLLGAAAAQPQPAPPPPKPIEERLVDRALENVHALNFDGTHFSGPGWDLLVREGAGSEFTLLGEEHGLAG